MLNTHAWVSILGKKAPGEEIRLVFGNRSDITLLPDWPGRPA